MDTPLLSKTIVHFYSQLFALSYSRSTVGVTDLSTREHEQALLNRNDVWWTGHTTGDLCAALLVDSSSKCDTMYKHYKVRWRQRSYNEQFSCIGQTKLQGRRVRQWGSPSQPEGLREAYMAGKML